MVTSTGPIETRGDLSLVACTLDLLDVEERGGEALASRLGVAAPAHWPPEYNGPHTRAWMRAMLEAEPDQPGYGGWYIVSAGCLAGICGFKGSPNESGQVEIGYSIAPDHQRRGIASAAVRLLVERAFRDSRVHAVVAETLPSLAGSRAVLDRCGFSLASRREDPDVGEVLRYRRARD